MRKVTREAEPESLKRVFLEELIKTCEEDSYPSVIESVVEELLRI